MIFMLTSKQRAYLKSISNKLNPVFQIGKSGLTAAQISQIDDYLRVHEIMKIRVLDNSLYTAKEASAEIAEVIEADVVQVIGSIGILYKANKKEPKIQLPR